MEGRTPSQAPLRAERTERGRERMAVRAGRVRIAIGSVGVVAAFSMADIAPYRIAFVAYLVLALVFQRIIAAAAGSHESSHPTPSELQLLCC